MGGAAANSLAVRLAAICSIAGRARANGDCVESCRSKALGASATGGAPGQVVCEIVPEESYAHCPADGSAPILDLDTGACWWASSAVPVGHRCCNLGVEPRCGLPPTPEPNLLSSAVVAMVTKPGAVAQSETESSFSCTCGCHFNQVA